MRHSRSRTWILLGVMLAICFAIGFGIGAFPSRWRELQGEKPSHLTLLASDSRLIPKQFFLDYEKATGKTVDVQVVTSYHLFRTESQNADLLFAPLAWLASFPEPLQTLPDQSEFHQLLSTDFSTMQLEIEFFLPILWKTEQKFEQTHLLIWGFATPQAQGSEVRDFLQFLLNGDRKMQEWARAIPDLSFTLQRTNEIKNFPELQRAQAIRSVSLADLVIDQKIQKELDER